MRCSTWPASMPTTKRCTGSDAVAGFPSRPEMPVAESHRVIHGQIAFPRGKDSSNRAGAYGLAGGFPESKGAPSRFVR